jgi:uncharacterized OsmC-like protein
MSGETLRTVNVERIGLGRYRAVNAAGASIEVGGSNAFSAVELLLAAMACCSAADVDHITTKRAPPETFAIEVRADKVRDEDGNHLTNIELDFHITFPDTKDGRIATSALPRAIAQTRDRLCTVTRTVALPNQIEFRPPAEL